MRTILVLVLCAFLALAACGGSDVTVDTPGADVVVDGDKVNVDTPGADVNVDTSGADVAVGGNALDKLKAAISGRTVKYTATYDMSAAGQTMQFTQAFDLPKYAIDMVAAGVESKTIFDGNSMVTCTKSNGWQCFKVSTGQTQKSAADASGDLETSIKGDGVTVVAEGSCTRAGESGTKYKVTTGETSSTICYTSDGILLEMQSASGGQSVSMVATSVKRSVASGAFTPPAEPQDLSAYGNFVTP